MPVAAVL